MNIKQIVAFIAFCGFSAGIGNLPVPVPHIPVHKPKPSLVGIPKYVQIAARKSGLPPRLIKAVIHVESRGKVDAVSSAGAIGPMQLMGNTAKMLHVNPWNPKENIEAGIRYFRYLYDLFKGNYVKAIAAYNAGEKAVIRYKGIPPYPETQWYVAKVLKAFWKMKGYSER